MNDKYIRELQLDDGPGITYGCFDEHTIDDARLIVRKMFGERALGLLEHFLANPARRYSGCSDAGDIAYENGRPVGFQAVALRRMYWGRDVLWGVNGSTLCADPNASPTVVLNIMRRTMAPRADIQMKFGNSACKAAVRMNRMLGVRCEYPELTDKLRLRYVGRLRRMMSLSRSIMRKVLRSVGFRVFELPTRKGCWRNFSRRVGSCTVRFCDSFEPLQFNAFWDRYVQMNKGLVVSRSAEELEWAYGRAVARGKKVILGLFDDADAIVGYIVLRHVGGRYETWKIADWIALGNDLSLLECLLKGSLSFIKDSTWAAVLCSEGFCAPAQDLLGNYLTRSVPSKTNRFLYKFLGDGIKSVEPSLNTLQSWFFGPYDGDEGML